MMQIAAPIWKMKLGEAAEILRERGRKRGRRRVREEGGENKDWMSRAAEGLDTFYPPSGRLKKHRLPQEERGGGGGG